MFTNLEANVDVVVVGGGPAGSAAALILARAGLSTVLFDAGDGKTQQIGETLPPVANRILIELGLWDAFCKQEHLSSQGIVSVWTDTEPRISDFFLLRNGPGWNLDRNSFDAMLLGESSKAGAVVVREGRITSCRKGAKHQWNLSFVCDGSVNSISARYLLDATGRKGASALGHLSKRSTVDRLMAAARFFQCDNTSRYTLIEAVDEGWFYSAGLPGGRTVVTYFTDADIYAYRLRSTSDYWYAQLRKATQTISRVEIRSTCSDLMIVSAATSRKHAVQGQDWIAAGDAAHSFDPLSSLGIYKALDSAIWACHTILEGLRHRASNWAYGSWSNETFRFYMQQRANLYGRNKRFSEYAFWKRRREMVA